MNANKKGALTVMSATVIASVILLTGNSVAENNGQNQDSNRSTVTGHSQKTEKITQPKSVLNDKAAKVNAINIDRIPGAKPPGNDKRTVNKTPPPPPGPFFEDSGSRSGMAGIGKVAEQDVSGRAPVAPVKPAEPLRVQKPTSPVEPKGPRAPSIEEKKKSMITPQAIAKPDNLPQSAPPMPKRPEAQNKVKPTAPGFFAKPPALPKVKLEKPAKTVRKVIEPESPFKPQIPSMDFGKKPVQPTVNAPSLNTTKKPVKPTIAAPTLDLTKKPVPPSVTAPVLDPDKKPDSEALKAPVLDAAKKSVSAPSLNKTMPTAPEKLLEKPQIAEPQIAVPQKPVLLQKTHKTVDNKRKPAQPKQPVSPAVRTQPKQPVSPNVRTQPKQPVSPTVRTQPKPVEPFTNKKLQKPVMNLQKPKPPQLRYSVPAHQKWQRYPYYQQDSKKPANVLRQRQGNMQNMGTHLSVPRQPKRVTPPRGSYTWYGPMDYQNEWYNNFPQGYGGGNSSFAAQPQGMPLPEGMYWYGPSNYYGGPNVNAPMRQQNRIGPAQNRSTNDLKKGYNYQNSSGYGFPTDSSMGSGAGYQYQGQ